MSRVTLIPLFLSLIFISCQKSKNTKDYSISSLLEESLEQDTLEYSNWNIQRGKFLFFKAGNFLSNGEKHAICIQSHSDSIYFIELYSKQNKNWIKTSLIDSIILSPIQFDIKFEDFNFDNEKDIYIQTNVTNGSGISSGLVFIKKQQELSLNEHLSYLGNLKVDKIENLISSENMIFCKIDGQKQICTTTYKWEADKVVTLKTNCPCEAK